MISITQETLECDWCEQDIEKGWQYIRVKFEDGEVGVYHNHCRLRFNIGKNIEAGVA